MTHGLMSLQQVELMQSWLRFAGLRKIERYDVRLSSERMLIFEGLKTLKLSFTCQVSFVRIE
jgi:hypothetical protein